jgi:hypothetical protein
MRSQELFEIARGGTTLGWNGHYVHEAAKNPEGVVGGSVGLGLRVSCCECGARDVILLRLLTTSAILLLIA